MDPITGGTCKCNATSSSVRNFGVVVNDVTWNPPNLHTCHGRGATYFIKCVDNSGLESSSSEITIILLGFCLFRLFSLRFFFILIPFAIFFFSILEPFDERGNLCLKCFLCLSVIEDCALVKLCLSAVPGAEPIISVDLSVVEHFAECTSVLLLLRVFLYEEKNDSLEEMNGTFFSILFHQFFESLFVSTPVFDDIMLRMENTAQKNIEFVIFCDIELELDLTNF